MLEDTSWLTYLYRLLKSLDLHNFYNPSVRITNYLLTPPILCVFILYMCNWTFSLKSTQNEWMNLLSECLPEIFREMLEMSDLAFES